MKLNILTKYIHKYHFHSLATPKISHLFNEDIVLQVALHKFLHVYVIHEAKPDQTTQYLDSLTPLLIYYTDIFIKS